MLAMKFIIIWGSLWCSKTFIYYKRFVRILSYKSSMITKTLFSDDFNHFEHACSFCVVVLKLLAQFMDMSIRILYSFYWCWLNLCKALGMVIWRIVEIWIYLRFIKMIIDITIISRFSNFLLKRKPKQTI